MTKNSTYWLEYGGKGVAQFNFKNKSSSSSNENENNSSSKENTASNDKEKDNNKEAPEENKWKMKTIKTDMIFPMHFILFLYSMYKQNNTTYGY